MGFHARCNDDHDIWFVLVISSDQINEEKILQYQVRQILHLKESQNNLAFIRKLNINNS